MNSSLARPILCATLLSLVGGCCCCPPAGLKEATESAIDQQDKMMEHQERMMEHQERMIRSFPSAQPQSDGLQILRTDVQRDEQTRTLSWQVKVENTTPFQYFREAKITVYDKDGTELFSDSERDTIAPKGKLMFKGDVTVEGDLWDRIEYWEFRIGR